MSKVNGAKKLTDNRFLNLYELNAETKDNKPIKYLVASRAKEVEDLKAINHKEKSDAVAILGITSDKKVVLGLITTKSPSIDIPLEITSTNYQLA